MKSAADAAALHGSALAGRVSAGGPGERWAGRAGRVSAGRAGRAG